jgi:hypothetical protein
MFRGVLLLALMCFYVSASRALLVEYSVVNNPVITHEKT